VCEGLTLGSPQAAFTSNGGLMPGFTVTPSATVEMDVDTDDVIRISPLQNVTSTTDPDLGFIGAAAFATTGHLLRDVRRARGCGLIPSHPCAT